MLVSLAFRNLWRNARRTVITMTALALGCGAIIGLHSYRDSVYGTMTRDITEGLIGALQVHGLGYQEAPSIDTVVKNPVQVEAAVKQALPNAVSERRVMGAGLAGIGDRSSPVMIVGLVPRAANGAKGNGLHSVVAGRDLSPEAKHELLIGRDLAADLGVELNGTPPEVVLVSQAADGSVANDRFTIVGTFTSASAELDAAAVMLHLSDAQDFFALGDAVHLVVVRLPEAEDVSTPLASVRAALDLTTMEALSWGEMLPELKETMRTKRESQRVIDYIVMLLVGLGVFNAMTMSTFERTRELGVMAALGTRPRRILALIVTEALLQGAIAFVAGLLIALAFIYGFGTIDLSGIVKGDMMGARMPSVVQLHLMPLAVKNAATVAFGTVLIGGLLPALRAARLKPVEAMRHT